MYVSRQCIQKWVFIKSIVWTLFISSAFNDNNAVSMSELLWNDEEAQIETSVRNCIYCVSWSFSVPFLNLNVLPNRLCCLKDLICFEDFFHVISIDLDLLQWIVSWYLWLIMVSIQESSTRQCLLTLIHSNIVVFLQFVMHWLIEPNVKCKAAWLCLMISS